MVDILLILIIIYYCCSGFWRNIKLWDNLTKHRDRLLATILAKIYDK
ncbi:hypothetical protein [Myxosarcina sp. GI1(2024)]